MLGEIGGFGEAIYVLCLVAVSGYANRMFLADVIRDRFRVRLDTRGLEIKELVQAKTKTRQRRLTIVSKRKTADDMKLSEFVKKHQEQNN